MLKRITIQNFQSHKKTELLLTEGVNVITGISQSGKTAILRALNWVRENKPSGSRFVSHGKKYAWVEVETEEGYIVKIKYGKNGKEYFVTNIDGSTRNFRKLGTSVPEEISNILNISDTTFQKQLDEPYLITSSGGGIAKTINKITHIEKADRWISKLSKEINAFKKEKSIIDNDVVVLNEKREALSDIDIIKTKLQEAEKVNKKRVKLQSKWMSIQRVVLELEDVSEQVDRLSVLPKIINDQNNVIEINNEIEGINKVNDYIERYMQTVERRTELGKIISKVNTMLDQYDEYVETLSENNSISITLNKFITAVENVEDISIHLAALVSNYSNVLKNSGICPFCFSKINKNKIDDEVRRNI